MRLERTSIDRRGASYPRAMSESEIPNLKVLRQERGWSQQFLADQLKVTAHTVMRWEAGSNSPQLKDVRKLATFFGVSVSYLIGETEMRGDENLRIRPEDRELLRNTVEVSIERIKRLHQDMLAHLNKL
jgi:transcriptional regulator with XRE-family HTH domain